MRVKLLVGGQIGATGEGPGAVPDLLRRGPGHPAQEADNSSGRDATKVPAIPRPGDAKTRRDPVPRTTGRPGPRSAPRSGPGGNTGVGSRGVVARRDPARRCRGREVGWRASDRRAASRGEAATATGFAGARPRRETRALPGRIRSSARRTRRADGTPATRLDRHTRRRWDAGWRRRADDARNAGRDGDTGGTGVTLDGGITPRPGKAGAPVRLATAEAVGLRRPGPPAIARSRPDGAPDPTDRAPTGATTASGRGPGLGECGPQRGAPARRRVRPRPRQRARGGARRRRPPPPAVDRGGLGLRRRRHRRPRAPGAPPPPVTDGVEIRRRPPHRRRGRDRRCRRSYPRRQGGRPTRRGGARLPARPVPRGPAHHA